MDRERSKKQGSNSKSKLSAGVASGRMTAFGSTWGESSQLLDHEEYILGEMNIFSQSRKIFDMIAKQNSTHVQLSMVFYENQCSLCISHMNKTFFIKISSSISIKKKTVITPAGEPILACCFEIDQFRNMFSILLPGKKLEFAAVKADTENGVIMHFRQFAQINPPEHIEFMIHGIHDGRQRGMSTGQLQSFEVQMAMGATSSDHGCTISFQNAYNLGNVISFGLSQGFQYVDFSLKPIPGNRIDLNFYVRLAECCTPAKFTANIEGGSDNFKVDSSNKDFVASSQFVVCMRTLSIVSKVMEKDMPLTIAFSKNGYIYMTGKHLTDEFEVLLKCSDLGNIDSSDINPGSVMQEDDRSEDDSQNGSPKKSEVWFKREK